MGFIAGKTIKTDRDIIARFLLYIITPTVIFSGVMRMQNDNYVILLLPIIVYCMSCLMCWVVYRVTAIFFHDKMRNIIAFSSGSSNTGHFGLPIALMVLDSETVAIYIVAFLGITMFENTYGFYIAAKGYFTTLDCVKKILKLPALYAIIIGFFFNIMKIEISPIFYDFFSSMRSTYIVLGMSTIGLGLSTINTLSIDWRVISSTLSVKYILWPILMLLMVLADKYYLHLYTSQVHMALLILSVVPISVSTVVVGSVLNYPSEQLAWAVLISTLAGFIYVPAMLTILLNLPL